jgi:endonuclease-3
MAASKAGKKLGVVAKAATRAKATAAAAGKAVRRIVTTAAGKATTDARATAKQRDARPATAPKAPRRVKPMGREEAVRVFERLRATYPDAHCELEHRNPFELLVATVLSAQTTDVAVNKLTPALFRRYPDARALAVAEPVDVEPLLSTIGMFRQKAKNIVGLARGLVEQHGGEVPKSLAALVALPGVGRKTANVVLGVAFGAPEGVVVDTHVQRISQRLGWTRNTEPPEIEKDLTKLLPREDWDPASHVLIFHGRRCCFAIKPNCEDCSVNDACPSAFRAEEVGRKPKRVRPRP